MSNPFISLKHITKTYTSEWVEPVQVLKNITLDIHNGDFTAIMGPSGCGKSTLMNIIGLLDIPTTGEYTINGRSIQYLNEDEQAIIRRDNIWFVFQGYNLLKRMKAWQQVALPLSYMGVREPERYQRACEALQIVGLGEKINNLPNQLSWGQQQRVCIARSLVAKAWLILADEPTGALDSVTSREVMELFIKLNQEQGRTILLITHDHNIAQHAKRIIRMQDGIFL